MVSVRNMVDNIVNMKKDTNGEKTNWMKTHEIKLRKDKP